MRIAGSQPLEHLDRAQLERATAEGSRRIFRRFIMVVLGVGLVIGIAMVTYDVWDTFAATEYMLETSGERLVGVCIRLRDARAGQPAERVVSEASALTGVPMALLSPAGEVTFATDRGIARTLPRVYGAGGPTAGTRVKIHERLGSLSGAWIVAPYDAEQRLLVIVPRLAEEEGMLRYMTIGAGVMGLGLGVAFLFMLLTANWVLHQPLRRLVDQLTGALARDIEQRSRAERAAVAARLEAEQHLAFREHLLNAAGWVGIVAADAEGRIQIFNRAATEILGFEEAETEGKMCLEELTARLHREPDEPLPLPLRSLLQLAEGEELVVDKQGAERLLHSSVADIVDADGQRQGRLLVFFDVTHRKQLEAELQLNELRLIQSAKMASLGEMATGVAHELNQPLNNIALLVSRVDRKLRGHDDAALAFVREKLERIEGQVQRASRIIDQLRTFGRARSQEITRVELARPVNDVVDLLRQQFVERGIALEVDVPADLPPVETDPGQLEQVLINLLNNARDAMEQLPPEREDRRVRIRARRGHGADQATVLLRVSDNGPGMPREVAERVFDPFFTTKEVGKGTGLGLSISYGLVQGFGGRLIVASDPGQGTAFTVLLRVAGKMAPHRPVSDGETDDRANQDPARR